MASGTFGDGRDAGIDGASEPVSLSSSAVITAQPSYRATSHQRNTTAPWRPSENTPSGVRPFRVEARSMVGQHPRHARKDAKYLVVDSENGPTETQRPVDTFKTATEDTSRMRTEIVPATLPPPPPANAEAVEPRARKKNWRPHCRHLSCLRPASYACSDEDVPVFCEKHKIDGMQNIVHPNRGDCIHVGCARVSSYAATDDTLAHFCHLHKEKGMVKVRDRIGTRCEEVTCVKQASFAMEYERYPRFCKDHKRESMVNIRNHRCLTSGCARGASFAVAGDRRGIYCSEHKLPGMVNTRRRPHCLAPGCSSRKPVFVLRGQQVPKLCSEHGGAGMVDIRKITRNQTVLPDRARNPDTVAVTAADAGRAPPFPRDTRTPAAQPHIYSNISIVKRNLENPTLTSPSSSSSSSSSSSASNIAIPGEVDSPNAQGGVTPGPALKRRCSTSYPMYSKPSPGTKHAGDEPAPSHAPPGTRGWLSRTEPERLSKQPVGASDRRVPPAGTRSSDADTHSDTGAAGYRPRGFPPLASAATERVVGDAVAVDASRRISHSTGLRTPDAGAHSDTGAVNYRRRSFPPPASSISERNVTGVVQFGGERCGEQSVRPNDRTTGRFATGTAVRAGREVKADPDRPLSAAETSGKEASERDGGDLRSQQPLLGSTMARTTGAHLRFRVPYVSPFSDTQTAFSSNQRDTRQPGTTSAIRAYEGPPVRRNLIHPPLRAATLMSVKKEIGVCDEMTDVEPGTATTERKVTQERGSDPCKIPESRVSKEGGSSDIPVTESGAFAKSHHLEHGQPSGYSRTSFYKNLVKALTKKLEGRGSSTH